MCQLYSPAAVPQGKNPGTDCIGGLGDLEKRKTFTPAGVRTPHTPDRSLVTVLIALHRLHHLEDLSIGVKKILKWIFKKSFAGAWTGLI